MARLNAEPSVLRTPAAEIGESQEGKHNPKACDLGLCNVLWKGIELLYSKIILLEFHKGNAMFLIYDIDFYLWLRSKI